LNSGIGKVPAIASFFAVGAKNRYGLFGFLRFSLKWKKQSKIFSAKKKRVDKENPTVQN
jgi:hypothetical protein